MAGAKIVAFINYKGGVGKSTTYHVGCSLAQHHGSGRLAVIPQEECARVRTRIMGRALTMRV
jgi:hypothetical protein